MMETTLGEQLLLLSLDDKSGVAREPANVAAAIAGASLVELAIAGRIAVDGDIVSVTESTPVGLPSLDDALSAIADYKKPGKTADWIEYLKKDAVAAASQGLVDKGLVREETRKVLGLFPVHRYPEADSSVGVAVLERLEAAVLHGEEPQEQTVGLIALLQGAGLAKLAFPAADKPLVEARMAVIAQGQWAAPAVRQVIQAAQQALTAIVTTTVITSAIVGN